MRRTPRTLVAVPVAMLCVLGLGGCRDGERVALPTAAATTSAGSTPAASTTGSRPDGDPETPVVDAATPAADPLAGVEAELDAIERELDADGGSALRR